MNRDYRVIRLEVRDLRDLMAGFLPMIRPPGGYFWRTRQEVHEGEELLLEVFVRSLSKMFSFDCIVAGSLRQTGFDAEPGYVLAFKPTEDAAVQEMLSTVGWNLIGSNRRLHPRYQVTVPIAWRMEDREDLFVGHTANLSIGGAFVETNEPTLPGAETLVTLHIRDDGSEIPLSMVARVAWLRPPPNKPGMGLQFLHQDSETLRRFQRILERSIPENAKSS